LVTVKDYVICVYLGYTITAQIRRPGIDFRHYKIFWERKKERKKKGKKKGKQ
jgi:hypothetical protein